MSIHLIGGGARGDDAGEVYASFVAECAARAAGSARMIPRIAVVLVADPDDPEFAAGADGPDGDRDPDDARGPAARYLAALAAGGASQPIVTVLDAGARAESAILSDIDGLLIGGGMTPAYHATLEPLYDEIRLLVADGLPYCGFSAGAAIAAERAIVGGWRIDGIAVCPADTGEDLDEVAVVAGLGLVDLAIDVHAAQWGTLGRLVASVEAGLVPGGVAIDEDTALVVGETLKVVGSGNVWQVVERDDGTVAVGTLAP